LAKFFLKNECEVGDLRTTPTLRGLMMGLEPFNSGFAKKLKTTIFFFTNI
jgi:hypothetical protein